MELVIKRKYKFVTNGHGLIGKRSGTSRNSASSGDKKCLMLGEDIHRSGPLDDGELCLPLEFFEAAAAQAHGDGDTFRLLCQWRRRIFDVYERW